MRIAINGYGRIGRNITRALYESKLSNDIELVAINDLGDLSSNLHLTKYDSVHGRFPGQVTKDASHLIINNHKIHVYAKRNPQDLPWKDLEIDIVLEATGFFTSPDKAALHLSAGAKKVLISAPAGHEVKTIVYGVNENTLTAQDKIVSNASCTTNCLAPLAKILDDHFSLVRGLMVTVHAYTNDQNLTDNYHSDLHRARSATQSMIPTKTGAAAAVSWVLPNLAGKLDGYAIRVPTLNVSAVDLSFECKKTPSISDINAAMQAAAQKELKGILSYNDEPLVSVDFNHCAASAVFDATQTRQIQGLYKILAWYDNEWGFSHRMLNTALAMSNAS